MLKFSKIKLVIICIGLLISISAMTSDTCHGYIMPAEQLIGFLADRFSRLKTLIITQNTSKIDLEGEKLFREQFMMKSPDLFSLKVLDNETEGPRHADMSFRRLLISNSGTGLERLLSGMGINLKKVSFTRIEGIIAYRIGDKTPDSPKLLLEKETFLPLLLTYRLFGKSSGEMASIRFKDYRKQDGSWYPFDITYSVGDRLSEHYTIQTFQPNATINGSLLQTIEVKSRPDQAQEKEFPEIEEERLRKIIRAFEEKYR